MVRFLKVLKGKAKRSTEIIGMSVSFYATTLKLLKRDFGDPIFMSNLKLKLVLDKPQTQGNNWAALRKLQ